MSEAYDDPDGLRARSEQAIGEFAQALLDSQVLENAVSAAFGAREKEVEAQHAAMSALNPKHSSNSRTSNRPPSDVTREPWKSTFKQGLKES